MKDLSDWEGTQQDIKMLLHYCIGKYKEQFDITDNKLAIKLFCEAFARNTVQEEMRNQLDFIINEQ